MRAARVNVVTIKDAENVLKQSPHELFEQAKRGDKKAQGAAIFQEHRTRIVEHYKVEGPFCFVHVDLDNDVSRFDTRLRVWATRVGSDYAVVIRNATAVPNAIAWVVNDLEPRSVFLGLTPENPMVQAMRHLVFGKGETGLLVYQILLRHWASTPEDEPRPHIHLLLEGDGGPGARGAPRT